MTIRLHNPDFEFKGNSGAAGICDLRVFEHNGKTIVIATEYITRAGAYGQDGISITNAAGEIATDVRRRLGIEWDTYIEHYPARGGKGCEMPEEFCRVKFTLFNNRYRDPDWKIASRLVVETLIGEKLPEIYVD